LRGRFAPSPTGVLHLGNLRTALLAWLFARSAGSEFLMRIEDLDVGRVRSSYVDEQLGDLAAIGLDWDGEVVVQSSRSELYAEALSRLDVYECFCTRAEIREAASAAHGPVGAYPGTCRDLTATQRDVLRAQRSPALRVRAGDAVVGFEDRVAGHFEGVVDDFVVRRNDGAYAYNLAVVVDDGLQAIEEIVRGADLLDSTPRQIWLGRALGLAELSYAHVPLVLGPDGRRLAKRDGDVTLREVAPGDAVAWMASSLGLPPARTAADLLPAFDPAALPREPTTLNTSDTFTKGV
jgi:glutamyl-tRNA synthetase